MLNTASAATRTPIRPAFDAELLPGLDMLRAGIQPLSGEILPVAREMLKNGLPGQQVPDLTAGGKVTVEERKVSGPRGEPDITVLILRPANVATPTAGIYHIHEGGMVLGSRRMGVQTFLPFVARGTATVVSVEYRLAPEHPDPAPVEDCYAGLAWTASHASGLGIDPNRLIIAGASAGGGLAAGTALLARDRGGPSLSHQVLICPMLDDRLKTHSSQMLDGEGFWDRSDNLFGWTSLLGDRRGSLDVSPYAAPARAENLSGLPRTYIDCGSVESFRDEILLYAARLSKAGVVVDLHMWGGGFHGFDSLVPHAAVSQASTATREEFIRRALEG